jgi:hypothetical protein
MGARKDAARARRDGARHRQSALTQSLCVDRIALDWLLDVMKSTIRSMVSGALSVLR